MQDWFLNKIKSRERGPESPPPCAMSGPVGGPWETSEAEEQQTWAVHSSASACWGQLTHAGIKTDASTVQSYRGAMPLQEPACPRFMSHLSPACAAKSLGSSKRFHVNMRWCTKTKGSQTCTQADRKPNTHTLENEGQAQIKPICESVSHGPRELLSRPHVLTTRIDHVRWPEVLLAWGSMAVPPHWNGLADSRPNSLAWCYPAWLPSCLERCRCHLTSGRWECVVRGGDTFTSAALEILTAYNHL